jgi:hypothetical protein
MSQQIRLTTFILERVQHKVSCEWLWGAISVSLFMKMSLLLESHSGALSGQTCVCK